MLPNFLIVGAPKAGTTSLYHYISEHPEVFMPTPKELNFFSREEIEAQKLYYKYFSVKTLKDYEALFEKGKDKKAIGEASVSYLFYPQTPFKIKKIIPNVKIIILLRDPTERAFSHYLMDHRLGLVDMEFEDVVFKKVRHRNLELYYQQYIELGFYYNQVKRYVDLFSPNQIRVYLSEELRKDSQKVILDLYDFLRIDKSYLTNAQKKYNVSMTPNSKLVKYFYSKYRVRKIFSSLFPNLLKDKISNFFFKKEIKLTMKKETEQYLRNIYEPDVKKLEEMLNRNLSCWYKLDGK